MTGRRARILTGTAVAAVYGVLAVLLTITAWRAPSTTYIGEGPDPISAMWGIGWVPFAVGHGLNPLLSTYLNHPTGIDLLWNDPQALPIAVLWPVTALFGATVTYNLVMTLSLALASFLAFLVIRRWVPGLVAAALGGLLYGFSPYMTGQLLGHVNLVLSGVTAPLALMLLDEIVVRQRRRPLALGVLTALLAIVQFFIAQEVLLTEVLVAGIVTVVLAITHRNEVRARALYALRVLACAFVPLVALLAYPVWLQFFGADHVVNAGAIHGSDIYVTDPANFVVPTIAQLISPPFATAVSSHFSGNASEWDAYLGIPLIVLLIVAMVRFRRVPVVRTAGIVALILVVLSLGPHLNVQRHPLLGLPLPWWIPAHLPVLDDILPNRLMMYADLAAAIVFAFFVRMLWLVRSQLAVNVAVAVVVLLPLVPTIPAQTTSIVMPAAFASGRSPDALRGAVVLFEPFPSNDFPDAMTWQRNAGYSFLLAGGYIVGPAAPGSEQLQQRIYELTARSTAVTLTAADRESLEAGLRALGVNVVVAGEGGTPGIPSLFTQLIGAPPVNDGGFLIWSFALH
jgi:hypothetical protein